MNFHLLSPDIVETIHDDVLNLGELVGLALDKSLDGALAKVRQRLAYGMIKDVFELAAAYGVVISTGHYFNDGNKRTAFRSMQVCLELHGMRLDFAAMETGQIIISAAQGFTDEAELANWLRAQTR